MSVKLLIDMNLAPAWVDALRGQGWHSVHWITIGRRGAPDTEIMTYARDNGFVVFTHDLDFGHLLAFTHARGPSVLQIRGQDVLPDRMLTVVTAALSQHEAALAAGAIVVVDVNKSRVRVLPF